MHRFRSVAERATSREKFSLSLAVSLSASSRSQRLQSNPWVSHFIAALTHADTAAFTSIPAATISLSKDFLNRLPALRMKAHPAGSLEL
jgi:hypothetical protein